jgi:phosphate transport system substrate-binding protein
LYTSDGSGTQHLYHHLSKVSAEWAKSRLSTAVNGPKDVGGKGNEGVANSVKQIPGAIGYVEWLTPSIRCLGRFAQ